MVLQQGCRHAKKNAKSGEAMKEKIMRLMANPKTSGIILVAGIIGIALIFLSNLSDEKTEETPQKADFSQEEYCLSLENEIKEMVGGICGDFSSTVTVTLDTGIVYEYATEVKEKDSKDESKQSAENEKNYITVKDKNGAETPLIITSYMPRVRGVSVICSANEDTAEKIKNAVSAALDINSRKIYVGRKMTNEKG